jgi:hypothetical protein
MLQDVNKGKVNTSLLALSCFTTAGAQWGQAPLRPFVIF